MEMTRTQSALVARQQHMVQVHRGTDHQSELMVVGSIMSPFTREISLVFYAEIMGTSGDFTGLSDINSSLLSGIINLSLSSRDANFLCATTRHFYWFTGHYNHRGDSKHIILCNHRSGD